MFLMHWFLSDKNHFVFAFSGVDKANLLQQVSELSNEMESIQKNGFKQEEVDDDGRHWFVSEIQRRAD